MKHLDGTKYREYLKSREVALSFITISTFVLSAIVMIVYYAFHLAGGQPGTGVGYFGITVIFLFFALLLWLKKTRISVFCGVFSCGNIFTYHGVACCKFRF